MDDRNPFERRLAAGLEAYAGPRRSIDPAAIARAAASPLPRRRSIALRFLPRALTEPGRTFADTNSLVGFAVTVAAVLIVAGVVANLLPAGPEAGGVPTSASPSASPTAPSVTQFGFPLRGATPSAPERGELVVQLEASTGSPLDRLWVYADGRIIWHGFGGPPKDASEAPIGLVEQRLTAEGVEFLRSAIVSTDLFGRDLALAHEDDAPFLEIHVRNGDRLVRATWAVRLNSKIGSAVPTATTEQAGALTALRALLSDPASWPASIWADRAIKGYVPARYSVCFRALPQPIEPARVWAVLPEAAQTLVRAGDLTPEESVPTNAGCSWMTTDDARTLARIMDDVGIPRWKTLSDSWLGYRLEGQRLPVDMVWMTFAPVLPHGEAIWLGPG
ncbi:MAG TPA: hypothetical protein VFP66_06125 [Candidatus Limnocylindrales bacterium]|nr:hypothetical protein [Candidatus Limnocylindrales bacterium]